MWYRKTTCLGRHKTCFNPNLIDTDYTCTEILYKLQYTSSIHSVQFKDCTNSLAQVDNLHNNLKMHKQIGDLQIERAINARNM